MNDPIPDLQTYYRHSNNLLLIKQSLLAKGFEIENNAYEFQMNDALESYFNNKKVYKIVGDYFSIRHLKEIYNEYGQPVRKNNFLDINTISDARTFFKAEYCDKIYYFFGELHSMDKSKDFVCSHNTKCYSVGNIIDKIISEEKMTDIFIEASYKSYDNFNLHRGFYWPSGNLFKYNDFISQCLNADKNICPGVYRKKARFHYTDLRLGENATKLDPLITIFRQHEPTAPNVYRHIKRESNIIKWYSEFLDTLFTTKDLYTTDYAYFLKKISYPLPLTIKKIQRQIQNLDKKYKNALHTYINMHKIIFEELHNNVISKFSFDDFLVHFKEQNACKRFIKSLFIDFYMDIYLLSRMFRRYSKQVDKESKIVIVYTGSAHTQNYLYFFKHFLHITPKIVVDPCIDFNKQMLNGIHLPKQTIQLS